MSDRQRRATAAELLNLHQPAGNGLCRCDRSLPCPVATAARDTLHRSQPTRPPAVGRAGVRYWAPRWGLMRRASQSGP